MRPLLTNETCWKVAALEHARVLVDADEYYRAFCTVAPTARRQLCLLGWQFDSLAQLLPSEGAPPRTRFLPFLNRLCESAPQLRVFIGVWDYSVVYAIEREWFQRWKFEHRAHPRVEFRLLRHPQPGGAHHQKIVVADDRVAFTGGCDVCDERWDERAHAPRDPRRINVKGRHYGPFHDVQVLLKGPIVEHLSTLFWRAWHGGEMSNWADTARLSSLREPGSPGAASNDGEPFDCRSDDGEPLDSSAPESGQPHADALLALPNVTAPLSATRAGLSRTVYGGNDGGSYEVQRLYEHAIAAAQELIYIENQYFTSRAIVRALAARLSAPQRPKLQILVVMPDGGHSKKEQFVLGSRQRLMLCLVSELAHQHGHQMRLLMSCPKQGPRSQATYIHSKLMIVDDRFLTIGSANLMNRSLRVDSELNISFDVALEGARSSARLAEEIAELRASLLAEHAGLPDAKRFRERSTLIEEVDEVCAMSESKLVCRALRVPPTDDPLRAEVFDPSGPLNWDRLDNAIEQALRDDQGPVRSRARRFGQRMGLVDIE